MDDNTLNNFREDLRGIYEQDKYYYPESINMCLKSKGSKHISVDDIGIFIPHRQGNLSTYKKIAVIRTDLRESSTIICMSLHSGDSDLVVGYHSDVHWGKRGLKYEQHKHYMNVKNNQDCVEIDDIERKDTYGEMEIRETMQKFFKECSIGVILQDINIDQISQEKGFDEKLF